MFTVKPRVLGFNEFMPKRLTSSMLVLWRRQTYDEYKCFPMLGQSASGSWDFSGNPLLAVDMHDGRSPPLTLPYALSPTSRQT